MNHTVYQSKMMMAEKAQGMRFFKSIENSNLAKKLRKGINPNLSS